MKIGLHIRDTMQKPLELNPSFIEDIGLFVLVNKNILYLISKEVGEPVKNILNGFR